MTPADDLQQLTSSLWLWQNFDPNVKTDLFSTAVLTQSGLFLIDPIPLAPPLWEDLTTKWNIAGIFLTNANHLRNAIETAQRWQTSIFTADPVLAQLKSATSRKVTAGQEIAAGVTVIGLEGAAEGEMAIHFADDGGTIVVGDALINFDPYGFALLPAKYCSDQKLLRRSLRQLLDFPFDRLCFAHGLPLISGARTRLEGLLR